MDNHVGTQRIIDPDLKAEVRKKLNQDKGLLELLGEFIISSMRNPTLVNQAYSIYLPVLASLYE